MLLTEEQIANFPVKHFSMSSLRQYMSDQQMFFKRYIRLEFDNTTGPAAIEGSALHAILEQFWTWKQAKQDMVLFDFEDAMARQIQVIKMRDAKLEIEWGKTGSLESSIKNIRTAYTFYLAELPPYKKILSTEQKFLTDFEDLAGNPMPIPLKGFCDLIIEDDDGELVVVDHKLVAYPKLQEEVDAGYQLQAAAYWFLVRKYYNRNPKYMIFDQIKKTKNRDGSPQLTIYRIDYTPELLETFLEIYRRITLSLAGVPLIDENGSLQFIPNPFAMFDGNKSWEDFSEEVQRGSGWKKKDTFDPNALADDNIYDLDL